MHMEHLHKRSPHPSWWPPSSRLRVHLPWSHAGSGGTSPQLFHGASYVEADTMLENREEGSQHFLPKHLSWYSPSPSLSQSSSFHEPTSNNSTTQQLILHSADINTTCPRLEQISLSEYLFLKLYCVKEESANSSVKGQIVRFFYILGKLFIV